MNIKRVSWLIIGLNSVLGFVVVGDVDVSEVYVSTIFRVELCRLMNSVLERK
jgi:hypothetical protein